MSAIRHFGLRWALPVAIIAVAWGFAGAWLGLAGPVAWAVGFLLGALVSFATFTSALWAWRSGPPTSSRPPRALCGFEYPPIQGGRSGHCVKPEGHAPPWHRDEWKRVWYRVDFEPPKPAEFAE